MLFVAANPLSSFTTSTRFRYPLAAGKRIVFAPVSVFTSSYPQGELRGQLRVVN